MHLVTVSVDHGVGANIAITALIYLFDIAVGGIWGIAAVYTYFSIEIAFKGLGQGLVAAGFFPAFMSPWAVMAGWTVMQVLDGWIEVLSPGREVPSR